LIGFEWLIGFHLFYRCSAFRVDLHS